MNLTERIYGDLQAAAQKNILLRNCSKKEFIQSCDAALGAFKLSFWSDIDPDVALRLVTRYWNCVKNNANGGTPLTMDDSTNAIALILTDDFPKHLLEMSEKEFFHLVTQAALDNMASVAEESWERLNGEDTENE